MNEQKHICIVATETEREEWDNALSDFLCWISGFKAGGGSYSPGSEGVIHDIRDAVKRGYQTTSPKE